MSIVGFIIVAALAGVVARTLLPFLVTLRDNPNTPFDRAFLVPPLVSTLIAVFGLPLVLNALPPEVLNATEQSLQLFTTVFVAAWGASDIVREGQKLLSGKSKS